MNPLPPMLDELQTETSQTRARQTSSCPSQPLARIHVACFLGISLIFLYLRTFLLPGTPLVARGDQMIFYQHADHILQGQVAFRDYFATVLPGTDLLYAAILAIFGTHAWVPQAVVIALGFAIAWTTLWICSKILRTPVVFLPAVLFLVLDYDSAPDATHHWYSTLLVMLAAGVLLDRITRLRLVFAGALCGIATIFTQTRGVLGLAALCVYIVFISRNRLRSIEVAKQLALVVLSFAAVVGSILAYYMYHAGISSLTYALLYFAVKYVPTFPVYTWRAYFIQIPPHQTLGDLPRVIPYFFTHILVPFIYIASLIRLARVRDSLERRQWNNVFLITLAGIAIFAAVATGPTYHRLCMAAPPAIIVCVWMFSGATRLDRAVRFTLWIIGIGSLLYLPLHRQLHYRASLDLPAGRTAFDDAGTYEENKWFAQVTRPGQSFFTESQLSFSLRLRNPTPLDHLTPYEFTRPEQVDAVVRALADHQTPWIYLYPEIYEPHAIGDNLAPFRDYLRANYHLVKVYPFGQFWQRN